MASSSSSSSKVFSILGKNLKANTAADLEPYLSELKELEDVEEVHFGANSLGVEACQAIAEVLKTKKHLKVCAFPLALVLGKTGASGRGLILDVRWWTWPTCLPAV